MPCVMPAFFGLLQGNPENLAALLAAEPGHKAVSVFCGDIAAGQLTAEEEEQEEARIRTRELKKGTAAGEVERLVDEMHKRQKLLREELQVVQAQLRQVSIEDMGE